MNEERVTGGNNGRHIYGPPEVLDVPRFTGPRTFARLPHLDDLDAADGAVFGLPSDVGTSFRTGARFGPESIRSASTLLRPYNANQDVSIFGSLSLIDFGDVATVPGYLEKTLECATESLRPIFTGGTVGFGMGGDHSMTLAEFRACAEANGPLSLVHLDAHSDLWDRYYGVRYGHGTVMRRAVEEGLVDPATSIQAGMRGPLYDADDERIATDLGFEFIPWRDLSRITPGEFGDRVRSIVGDLPAFLSFDVDFVDPAFCPGTGTPEVGGPSSHQALELVRSLTGIDFRGFDVMEVAPSLDGPGQVTSYLAATVIFEMMALFAIRRSQSAAGASSL